MMLTVERLRELLHYDPKTGVFTWRVRRGSRAPLGGIAGSINADGYRLIGLEGIRYLAHRLAWLYMTGVFPPNVDHRNRRNDDNRWSNLRAATKAQNSWNRPMQANNKSGFKGVSYSKSNRGWVAQIMANRRKIHLGTFATPLVAATVYERASRKYHGDFAKVR